MLEQDAKKIYMSALAASLPDAAVREALRAHPPQGDVTVFAIGKAAARMAHSALEALGGQVRGGVAITKYAHLGAGVKGLACFEAAHPIPDENGLRAARHALALARELGEKDTALVLLSGGGSALLTHPAAGVTLREAAEITARLLRCGADITEINCVRKHLSAVKGGRLAQAIAPARVLTVALSDVLSDAADVIASGPTCPDGSTCAEASKIVEKYRLPLSEAARAALARETPKALPGTEMVVCGSVRMLCEAARQQAQRLGYAARVVDTALTGEARAEGARIGTMAKTLPPGSALIFGGETVVRVRGQGQGGRCQEMALGAAQALRGLENVCFLAAGSDGTDGPTDAAGAVVNGNFAASEAEIAAALRENDAYPLLKRRGALLFTGATGTNVNDLYLLLKR